MSTPNTTLAMRTGLAALLLLSGSHRLLAQQVETKVRTEPVGIMSLSVGGRSTEPLSVPLKLTPVFTGTVDQVSGANLTSHGTGWQANTFAPFAQRPHIVRFLNGEWEGRFFRITAQTANRLTLDRAAGLAQAVEPGDQYEIVPVDTLKSLFGSNVLSHKDPTKADNVSLLENNQWVTYFHNGRQWVPEKSPNRSADMTPILPEQAVLYFRRDSRPLVLRVAGTFPHDPHVTELPSGSTTLLGNPFPHNIRLNDLELHLDPAWKKGTNPKTADCVQLHTRLGWATYTHNGSGWLKEGKGAYQNPQIPVGSGLVVVRQRGGSAWHIPVLPLTPIVPASH